METTFDRCPDCNVGKGRLHILGCDIEPCPYCGLQLLSCEHFDFGNEEAPSSATRDSGGAVRK